MNVDQLEDHLRAKYKGKLEEHANGAPMLDLMDKTEYGAFELKLIQVKKDQRGRGVGGQVMNDLLKYADDNNYIIVLSPSEIKTAKLIKWYKSFDFMENKNRNKDFRFMSRMIRYPHGMTRSKWIDANPATAWLDPVSKYNLVEYGANEFSQEQLDAFDKKPTTESRQRSGNKLNLKQCLEIRENQYRSRDGQHDYQPEEIDERILELTGNKDEREMKRMEKLAEDMPEDFYDKLDAAASYSPEILEKVRLERFNTIPKEKFYSLINSLIMPHEMEGFVNGLAESYLGDVQDSYRYLMGNYPAAFDTKRNKEKVFSSLADDAGDAYCAFHYSDDNATVNEYENDFVDAVSKLPTKQIPWQDLYIIHNEDLEVTDIDKEYIEEKFGTHENFVKETLKTPSIVFEDKGKKYLLDGQHRVNQHIKNGAKTVPVVIVKLEDFEGGREHPELYRESVDSLRYKPIKTFYKDKSVASTGHELKFKLSTIPGQRKAMEEKLEKLADQGKIEIGRVYKTNEPGESILIAHILWAEENAYQEIMKYLNLYKQMGDKYEMEFDKKIEQKAAAMSKFDKALQKVQQDYETGVYTGYLDPKKYEKELREELASISGKPIYRAVKLDHENQLDPKSIGIYWTWDKDKAVTYWGHEGTMTVTLESEASDDIVDWEATIEQWIKPQYNGECEVRLKPKAHVEVTNVWVNKIKKDKKFKAVALVNEDTTIKDATYSLSSRCDCEISTEDLRDLIAESKTKEFQPEQMKSIYRAHGETFFDHGDRTPVTLDEALDILYETDCPCVALKDGKYYALDGQHRINTAILCGSPLDIRVVDVKGLDFITHGYRLPEIKATIPSAAMYPLSNQTNGPTVDHRVVGSYTWEQVWDSWKKNHTGEVSENTPELKAKIEKFASFEKQSIPLDKIKFVYDSPFDPFKPLKPSEDEEWAVENYAKLKTEAPPVIAYEENGVYHLIDGRHRTRAAAFRGDKTITAFVANKDHL
jgi:ParB-like chromosome segregation protein Spo0J